MTAQEGNICFVSRESQCFSETKSRETFRLEGNKTDVGIISILAHTFLCMQFHIEV